jgi:transposase
MTKGNVCTYCGKELKSEKGRKQHETRTHKTGYRNEDVLKEMYIERGMSMLEIAREFDVMDGTIHQWLKRHGIETRSREESIKRAGCNFRTNTNGYEEWYTDIDCERYHIKHHRLLAVAKYGVEYVKDMDVHHKNEIKWDNRFENIELMTVSEHRSLHGVKR